MSGSRPCASRPPRQPTRRARQHGVAALGAVLVMLFVMSLTMLYLNRGLLVEIRSTADHRRAAAAFEAAEAGLEWATALLDDPRLRNPSCEPDAAAGLSFRDRYLPASLQDFASVAFVPRLDDRVGCRLDQGGLQCVCPAVGQALTFDPTYGPHFVVSFAALTGDGESVQVTSRGCIGDGTACARAFMPAASITSRPDALSRVQATLKLAPRLLRLPTAALTAGRDVRLNATWVANVSPIGAGWLVHAGGAVDVAAGASIEAGVAQASAGTPAASRLVANDPLLAALGPERLLRQLFGQRLDQLAADAGVRLIGHCTPVACGDAVSTLEREGWRSFVVDGDVLLPARDLGTMRSPVSIVASGAIGFAGASTVTGIVMTLGSWPGIGAARGRVVGAGIAGLDADHPALTAVSYDAGVLTHLRASGPLLRVPGSWSDE